MSAIISKRLSIAGWVLSILLGVFFLYAGGSKILGDAVQVANFARWGLPDWFRPIVGTVEVVITVLVLVPRWRFFGGLLIAATMAGGALTHVISGVDQTMIIVNLVVLALGLGLAWMHKPELSALQPTAK